MLESIKQGPTYNVSRIRGFYFHFKRDLFENHLR